MSAPGPVEAVDEPSRSPAELAPPGIPAPRTQGPGPSGAAAPAEVPAQRTAQAPRAAAPAVVAGPAAVAAAGPIPATAPAAGPGDAGRRRSPHRWGLGAYLLAEAVFLGSSVLVVLPFAGQLDRPGAAPPPLALLLGLTVPTLLAAGVAVLATVVRGNGPAADLGLRFDRDDIRRGLLFGCGGLALTIPAAAVWAQVVGPGQANSAVGEMFSGLRVPAAVAVALFLVVWLVAPVCEEIVYRGLLWGALDRHLPSRWWTLALTTLCFALAHFEFTRTPLLLIIGIPIGLARLSTGRLGASIIAHQINNLLPAVVLLTAMLGVAR